TSTTILAVTIGAHPDPEIDKVRIYLQGTGGNIAAEAPFIGHPTLISTGLLRLVGEFSIINGDGTITDLIGGGTNNDRTTGWEPIDRTNVGDGPYLASTIKNGEDLQPDVGANDGFYHTCAVHKGRIFCAGTNVSGFQNRVVWSNPNSPETFPATNVTDLPMTNGDQIIAIRSAGEVAIVIGKQSVWALVSDPDTSNHSVRPIANIGGLSKKACITVGQRVFFLGAAGIYAVGSGGAVELVTPQLNRLFRDLFESTINGTAYQAVAPSAVAGYDPSREIVYFGIPGLAQQLTDGSDFDLIANDAYLALNLLTARASILVGPMPSAMATVPTGNSGYEMWVGTYRGRLTRMATDALDTNATAAINGTATGIHSSTTLQDTGLSLTASSADTSFKGQLLIKSDSLGVVWEAREVVSNTTDTWTVTLPWTNDPINGDLYYFGHYFMAVESGDLMSEDPEAAHRIGSLSVHMESAMVSGNELTAATAGLPRTDSSTTFGYGGNLSTAVGASPVQRLAVGGKAGYTQRLRLLARMGATRFRLFVISAKRAVLGRFSG
ncbi:MAG: hypothetical protein V3S19_01170, partial [Gemmatimonadales bacterium]